MEGQDVEQQMLMKMLEVLIPRLEDADELQEVVWARVGQEVVELW